MGSPEFGGDLRGEQGAVRGHRGHVGVGTDPVGPPKMQRGPPKTPCPGGAPGEDRDGAPRAVLGNPTGPPQSGGHPLGPPPPRDHPRGGLQIHQAGRTDGWTDRQMDGARPRGERRAPASHGAWDRDGATRRCPEPPPGWTDGRTDPPPRPVPTPVSPPARPRRARDGVDVNGLSAGMMDGTGKRSRS